MNWYSKHPPKYVFACDPWIRETDMTKWVPDISSGYWTCDDKIIHFPKGTRVMNFGKDNPLVRSSNSSAGDHIPDTTKMVNDE